jgi:hypothetical protein
LFIGSLDPARLRHLATIAIDIHCALMLVNIRPTSVAMRSSLTRLSRKGRALLLKKSVGDEVSLQKPDGSEAWYQVLKVEYQAYDTGL